MKISSSKGSCPAAQRVFQEQIDHLGVGLGQRVGQGVRKKITTPRESIVGFLRGGCSRGGVTGLGPPP